MPSPLSTNHRPSTDSVAGLLQDLMKANLSSAVLAGFFSQKSAAKSPGFLSTEEALEYAGCLQELAVCEKEMTLLDEQLKEIQRAFTLHTAIITSYRNRTRGLSEAFKLGVGFKIGLHELGSIAQSNLHNIALARKNLDPQKISMAIKVSAKPATSPLTVDKALALKLNL